MAMETSSWYAGVRASHLRRIPFVLLLVPFICLVAGAFSCLAQEAGGLPFFVDTATFKSLDNSEKSYVEMYFLLSSKSLEFEQKGEEYWAYLNIDAALQDSSGTQRWSRQWRKEILLSSVEKVEEGYSILDVVGLYLDPDFYELRVNLQDELSGQKGFVTGELYAPAFPPDTLAISQLELAMKITTAEESGDFVKNGLYVLPNPLRTYGPDTPVLYYYVEIYGLMLGPGMDSTYTIQQEILTFEGDVFKSYQPKVKRKPGATCVEVGGINVMGLQPGRYFFRIKVKDNASGVVLHNQRWFRLSFPAAADDTLQQPELVLTPVTAQHYQDVIKFIASDEEMKVYKGLNLQGKASFLQSFWEERDPDPGTPANEFQIEHMRRWNYANQQYSRFRLDDGWKSDRGRVYILFGIPDDVERHPSDITAQGWERWMYYSIQGGVEFVFGDLGGFDNFVLLHSTARGEFRDRFWTDKILRTR